MPLRLDAEEVDFESRFAAFLAARRAAEEDVDARVAEIIEAVRRRGIDAVLELTRRFDRFEAKADNLAFGPAEMADAAARIPEAEREALALAARRIRAYHERQKPADADWEDEVGARLGWRWTPVASAGIYVPGGLASYPSSVLMNAIPARVAGVDRVEMCVPTPGGEINPLVLAAAGLAGVDRIWRIGGAQAIAALAFGAGPIAPVDKITGPGNAWVAAAKRRVFGIVGIDMIAGPSEVLVVADDAAEPDWVAADLLAQAEHDESAQAILITDAPDLAESVEAAVERLLPRLARRAIAATSWREWGAIIRVPDLAAAIPLVNRIAPEHLEICTQEPEVLLPLVRNAGAVFLGAHTPEAIGDYVAGPNHVLPTARSARFSSGLSVLDFMKRTSIAALSPGALRAIGPAAETLAAAEGLGAHALSVRLRLDAAGTGRRGRGR